jgi:prepilin-type processing-associated H-X9-DG protein
MMRRAFTLIELLVILAIVATLMGLLLPAVHRTLQTSDRIKCANNLRQIGLATHLYATDQDVLPPAPITLSGGDTVHWYSHITHSGNFDDPSAEPDGWLCAYYERNQRVWCCPSLNVDDGFYAYHDTSRLHPLKINYGVNAWLCGKRRQDFATHGTYLTMDSARPSTLSYESVLQADMLYPPSDTFHPYRAHFRHLGAVANVLFLDGHVEAMEAAVVTDAARRLGFPSAGDSPYTGK